ncbi:transposase [Acidiluteibacter ferrifornacis]|uniref:Transposase n=1 Tax=Acidiluteibacter ferrifornacis TaxID=2692424 RepID=A0A6N9NKR6_9FLAO|nr:transposase [Acidiluteibacter ferrifornacis]MBR9832440.1 transposase [bacterium]NBG66464.1 transposase [Acidiluteibacter ferrifornacis]
MSLFQKYISPIAHVYADCLIPNHFHFVLQIKSDQELSFFFAEKIERAKLKFNNVPKQLVSKLISLQFSHYFNSYTQAINKRYSRNGSLFSQNFKRKEIATNRYLTQVIIYVHLNPESHGVVGDFQEYSHSSYHTIQSNKKTLIRTNEVVELFGDKANFIEVHNQRLVDENAISDILDIDE